MIEASRILGFASVALLTIAIAAWLKLWRRPELARIHPIRLTKLAEGEIASRLLMLAAGLSAIAAMLAITGWVRNIG
jgi:hypothetical protein